MEINIKLDKNFTTQYNKLINEYGPEVAHINGFSDKQLSYTDFIDNFIDSDTVADASVDGNSNVGQKDIVTLINEMPKPHQKLLAFNKIYYELNKKYGFKTANQWLRSEWDGHLYMHDANTTSFLHYCFAYDLKDLAERGLFFIDNFNAEPPQHLETFVDFVKEFVSFTCNRSSGAVGLPNLIPYMYYFWKKDVDNNYYLGSPERYAKQQFQRLIYALNQPFLRSGTQSAFTNTSVFDRPYLEALFGGSEFPDGSFMIDEIDGIMEFQKMYMETMSEIRSKNMMTFPVSSISLLKQNGKFVDEEFAIWACKHNMKWNDSNLFVDSSVTSLSNCCFDGYQKTLTKSSDGVNFMTFKELYDSPYKETKRNFTVFHNGSWVKGKVIRMPKRNLYKICTANNKEIIVTDNHINVTDRGDISTVNLTTNDYLMFNNTGLNSIKEVGEHLTYEQGFFIGMYAGDGSMDNEESEVNTTTIHLSLNEIKYNQSVEIIKKAIDQIGQNAIVKLGSTYNNVYPVSIRNNKVAEFIRKFINGKYCFEKTLNMDCLLQSYDFRKGILDGYYLTDGGNSNRIYTTSSNMVDCLETLITSLGMQSIINVSDRTGDNEVVIRGESFNRNYPVYCIRWYEPCNRRCQKDVYKRINNSIFFKITSIERFESEDEYVYCFEMPEHEPYFTLPNGIITHNCRLKSNIEDLGYFNSVGSTALKVGSVKVNTINLARLALENHTEEDYLSSLKDMVILNLKALDCVRHIIQRNVDKGLLKNFSLKLVDFEHLYNTIGFIGIYETMKKFGYTTQDEFGNTFYTNEAEVFGRKIFDVIHTTKSEFVLDKNYQVNCEQIPGESAAAKLMSKDKIFFPDTIVDDLPLYGNQFMPLGIKTTLQERIRVAALFDSFCNGGSILHANIQAPFTNFEQAWDMLNYISDAGVTYFAFNTKIQACKHNHAFFGKICPECGEPVETEYTRIVGFYTPIKTYSKERKAEYAMRRWESVNET